MPKIDTDISDIEKYIEAEKEPSGIEEYVREKEDISDIDKYIQEEKGVSTDITEYISKEIPTGLPQKLEKKGFDPQRAWYQKIIDSLSQMGNITRAGIQAAVTPGESVIKNMGEAATMDREVTAHDLRKNIGIKEYNYGKGRFDFGDVQDFLIDMGIDFFTDPLNLVVFGVSSLAKQGAKEAARVGVVPGLKGLAAGISDKKIIEAIPQGAEALKKVKYLKQNINKIKDSKQIVGKLDIDELTKLHDRLGVGWEKLGPEEYGSILARTTGMFGDKLTSQQYSLIRQSPLAFERAAKYAMFKDIANPVVGAMFGIGTADEDTTAGGFLARAIIGAGVGKYAPKIFGPAVKGLGKWGDDAINRYFEWSRPTAFKELKDIYNNKAKAYVANQLNRLDPLIKKEAGRQAEEELVKVGPGARTFDDIYNKLKLNKTDSLTKKYQRINPIPTFSDAYMRNLKSLDKIRGVANLIKAGRHDALKGLTEDEIVRVTDYMHNFKNEFTKVRNDIFDGMYKQVDNSFNNYLDTKLEDGTTIKSAVDEKINNHINLLEEKNIDLDKIKIKNQTAIDTLKREGFDDEYIKNITGKDAIEKDFYGIEKENVFGKLARKEFGKELKTQYPQLANVPAKTLMWNLASLRANGIVDKGLYKTTLDQLDRDYKKLVNPIKNWVKHNEEIINLYNTEMDRNLIGIKWHTDDVLKRPDWDEAQEVVNLSTGFKPKLIPKETGLRKELGEDLAYAVYAERTKYNFLTKKEREAMEFVNTLRRAAPEKTTAVNLEKFGKQWARFTNWWKMNILQFGTVWLKNNYFDNLLKTYVESGLKPSVSAMFLNRFGSLGKDISNITNKKLSLTGMVFNDADALDMLSRGVLDQSMYDLYKTGKYKNVEGLMGDPLKWANSKENKNLMRRGLDKWADLLSDTSGRLGSYMEAYARAITYKHHKNLLMESAFKSEVDNNIIRIVDKLYEGKTKIKGVTKEEFTRKMIKQSESNMKDVAANIVSKTFFDYKKGTYFENVILKNIIPFYTFFSRNTPYWAGVLFDPEKIGKVANIGRIQRNVGRPLTPEERQQVTGWMEKTGPRVIGKTQKGLNIVSAPYTSLYDSLRFLNPKEFFSTLSDKIHPIPREAWGMITGRDPFTGGPFYPSSARSEQEKVAHLPGYKPLFGRGYTYKYLQDLARSMGYKQAPVHEDLLGNVYATSKEAGDAGDKLVFADKLISTIFPHRPIEQLAGIKGKDAARRENWKQGLRNVLSPIQVQTITPMSLIRGHKRYWTKPGGSEE